ncbi:unnamed protein product [Prunus brigantina]
MAMDCSADGIPQLAGQGLACSVSIDHIFEHTSWSLGAWCSAGMERLNWVSSADPKLASVSACAFSTQGTC